MLYFLLMLVTFLSFWNIFLTVFGLFWLTHFVLTNMKEIQYYRLKPGIINLISLAVPAAVLLYPFLEARTLPAQRLSILLSLGISFMIFYLRDIKKIQVPYFNVITAVVFISLLTMLFTYEFKLVPVSEKLLLCPKTAKAELDQEPSCPTLIKASDTFQSCVDDIKKSEGRLLTDLTIKLQYEAEFRQVNEIIKTARQLCPQ